METILQGVTTDADWRLYYEANPDLLPRTSFDADSHIKHHSHVPTMPVNGWGCDLGGIYENRFRNSTSSIIATEFRHPRLNITLTGSWWVQCIVPNLHHLSQSIWFSSYNRRTAGSLSGNWSLLRSDTWYVYCARAGGSDLVITNTFFCRDQKKSAE